MEAKLWRCEMCGDGYVGSAPPKNCPFCGAHKKYIKDAKLAQVTFDIPLTDKDKANVEHALEVELSNAAFYFCAAKSTDDDEGKILFKTLSKIEAEHATIWRKILKLSATTPANDTCHTVNKENLEDSHARETRAIEFYRTAAKTKQPRLKQLFKALVEVETDHLHLSEERLK